MTRKKTKAKTSKKVKQTQQSQSKEIMWNIINSLLAGSLVLLGACSTGSLDKTSIALAIMSSLGVAVAQFKKYWESEQSQYECRKFGSFI